MSRHITLDRFLIAGSTAWLATLLHWPELHGDRFAFGVTIAGMTGNAAMSLAALTRQRKILIGLNCVQLVLFGVLNYQLYCTFGPHHYRCDREPQFYDWIEFAFSHIIRAADLLDALDEYGLPIQTISHVSTSSALILLLMHLTVDVFLLGLAIRWVQRFWQTPSYETRLQQGRRESAWILSSIALFVGFGIGNDFSMSDWLLWPLDNLLRLIDIGDMVQLFGWRLHGVAPTYWAKLASVLFRLAAGIWMTRLVILWRLTVFRTWGVSVEDLIKLLDDPEATIRLRAATGLGQSGPEAADSVPMLIDALHDLDREVRVEAAWALGQIGPAAKPAVPRLVDAVWLGAAPLRQVAIEALGNIGAEASSAAGPLVYLLKAGDQPTRKLARRALERIAPGLLVALPASFGKPIVPVPLVSKRRAAWERSVEAARHRREQESALCERIVALRDCGYFAQPRDADLLQAVLAANGPPPAAMHVAMALLQLTADGTLTRSRDPQGIWTYMAAQ